MGLLSKAKRNAEGMAPVRTDVGDVPRPRFSPGSESQVSGAGVSGVGSLGGPPPDGRFADCAVCVAGGAPPQVPGRPSTAYAPSAPSRADVVAEALRRSSVASRQSSTSAHRNSSQASSTHNALQSPTFNLSHVAEKLNQIVEENQLRAWYNDEALHRVYERLSSINFLDLARRWRISPSIIFDLCSLALFDVVFFIDDSGSMVFEEDGTRIDDLKFILSKAAEVMTLFDDDGVQVRFMNSNVIGEGIRSTDHVNELVERVRFSGMTPLGTQFKNKVIDPIVLGPAISGQMAKPVLTIIITDGEPTREPQETLRRVIVDAKNSLSRTKYGPGALAIQIGQVGTDMRAQHFLSALDNDPEVGNMIDCTSNYEMESEELSNKGAELTPELWLLKLCVGAVDRGYDEAD
ncbi:hypothetical protein HK105_201772 [Polyrhizophydium stewartii]|uniref:VWFA domain-containing protein n=1 Tax=Polyrhizophydium stewartii TaxID=2732419 RepID=A0ABR4NHE2_9FUNG|nr:hypothetical protein HK105_002123 [Polyrhizophydium stewartii]